MLLLTRDRFKLVDKNHKFCLPKTNRMKTILTFLCLILCIGWSQMTHAQDRQADSLALVMLYNSTSGANWTTAWDLNQPMDNWNGVTLVGGRVHRIFLQNRNLTGTIPDLNLTRLTDLVIGPNPLSGSIPDFSNLPLLTKLTLINSGLTGSVPDFSNLPSLSNLWLNNNQLSGSIPNFSNLPNLTTLLVEENQLSGNVPNFSNLPLLVSLQIGKNQLSGNIPDFSNLPLLGYLKMSNNQLTGSIPDFSSLPLLEFLLISNNQLTGNIPDFSNLALLENVYIENNQLTGSIPDFSNLPVLKYLSFSNNQLTGSLPNFTALPSLRDLYLGTNQFSGNIPNFNNLPTLYNLDLSKNQLGGSIPDFNNLSTLYTVDLSDNILVGSIPSFSNFTNLRELRLSSNQLTGNLPLLGSLAFINRIEVSGNELTGNIPDYSTSLQHLNVKENKYTFEDFFPMYYGFSGRTIFFSYQDQDSIGIGQTINMSIGDNYTIDLVVDDTVTSNIYYWFKDGSVIDSTFGVNQYTISNFQSTDVGVYTAKVKNSVLFDPALINSFGDKNLYLYSRPVVLNLGTSIAQIPTRPLQVQPNPVQEILYINIPNNIQGKFEVEIVNLQGQVIQHLQGNSATLFMVPMQDKPAGVYIIRLTQGQQVWQEKVVKQ